MSEQYEPLHGARQPVDLDLIADYVGGALDPTTQRAVAATIANDPEWARAYEAVATADQSVRAQLHGYARSRIEPMPGDVAARIDDAWRALAASEPAPARTARIHVKPRRTRQARWAGLAAAAAAAIAIVGGGVVLGHLGVSKSNSTGADAGAVHQPEAATDSRGGSNQYSSRPPGQGPTIAFGSSGSDYTASTLYLLANNELMSTTKSSSVGDLALPDAANGAAKQSPSAPLAACLSAIERAHPGTIEKVDSARFNGTPALVVLIAQAPTGTGADGQLLVVAVGAQCGEPGVDELASQMVP